MTAHSYGKWTKKDNGQHERKCTCGDTQTAAHTWNGGTVTQKATCTKEGVKTFTCTACNATKTEKLAKTAHTYGGFVKKDDTNHAKKCTACGNEVAEKHSFAAAWKGDSKNHWHSCTGCTATKDSAAHTQSQWIIDRNAQPMKAGSKHIECTVCKRTLKTQSIPALDCKHDGESEVTGKKDATCTEDGYTGDTVCKICTTVLQAGEVIPAAGHTTQLQLKQDATCTEAGYTGDQVCAVCELTIEAGEEIPALGHAFAEGICTQCGAEDPDATKGLGAWWIAIAGGVLVVAAAAFFILKGKKKL